ncbi:MAG TPA: crossover junction endodeoxyribonuclease RuvC [Patescibacteria group bacterium]|jgi:crossover junction endodeoxyribonuclease RuvC|nr:crossover junction endodeoxyribonuclease RuvC [Patescibacteria group bacterium]
MIYLGIDPGTATTGYGIIKKIAGASKTKPQQEFEILEFGVISTSKTDSDAHRLQILFEDLSAVIKKHKPQFAGIEKLFFTNNQRTAMTVSQARGVILLAMNQAKVPILEFTPLQVKNTLCGYGKADKKQVQTMVQRTFKLKNIPKPDDAADALAIALCAAVWKK